MRDTARQMRSAMMCDRMRQMSMCDGMDADVVRLFPDSSDLWKNRQIPALWSVGWGSRRGCSFFVLYFEITF